MSEKETIKTNAQVAKQPTSHAKEVKRYSREKSKISEKQTESQTGPHHPRGKKQKRQFKLRPTEDKTT
jgi:hypothetical protein